VKSTPKGAKYRNLAFLVGFAGCASPSTTLVDSEEHVQRCATMGWGWAGAPLAIQAEHACVSDFKRLGYVPLPRGTMGVEMGVQSNVVIWVLGDSGASKAGIVAGDQIAEVDGHKVGGLIDIYRALEDRDAGNKVHVVVERDGQPVTMDVVLGKADR
jgi:predicted metalloprotease with PDZ domain